jgi:hypothetical protein
LVATVSRNPDAIAQYCAHCLQNEAQWSDELTGPLRDQLLPWGRVQYEWLWLLAKLQRRSPAVYRRQLEISLPEAHPLLQVVPGPIAEWNACNSVLGPYRSFNPDVSLVVLARRPLCAGSVAKVLATVVSCIHVTVTVNGFSSEFAVTAVRVRALFANSAWYGARWRFHIFVRTGTIR